MAQLSTKLPWDLAQTKWAATLNPVIAVPMLSGNQIDSIVMVSGIPQAINHLLQRKMQGWFLTDNTANANVWRTQPFNDTTITLQASANTNISIWVF